jgi:hypothetical protein
MRSSRAVAALASDWRPDSAIRGVVFTDTRNAECGDMHHLPAAYPWHALTSVTVSVIETSYALPVLVRSTGWRRHRPDSTCSRSQWHSTEDEGLAPGSGRIFLAIGPLYR